MSIMELLAMEGGAKNLLNVLTDPERPLKARVSTLVQVILSNQENRDALQMLLKPLLEQATPQHLLVEAAQIKSKYEQALHELEDGPLRVATFARIEPCQFGHVRQRALVAFSDGQRRPVTIGDHVEQSALRPGVSVWIDGKGGVLLDVASGLPGTGQVARFVRMLDGGQSVEVTFRDESLILDASYELAELAAAGQLADGDAVTFCPQRQFAFKKLPERAERQHRFIDADKIPAVIASRDVGNPHWILNHLLFRLHVLLYRPDLIERFRIRPRAAALLVGPSGVGKTLTIQAFLYAFQQTLCQFTGRNDVGNRVIRVKSSTLLSEWLGRTDKQVDSLFDDVIFLASQEFVLPDGRRVRLPVTLILEEIEGLGRRRGSDVSDVYDRILGMILQRLDDTTDTLAGLPIFILSTSNRADLIDSALVRRLGGVKAVFGRLDRAGFAAVLGKKVWDGFPCAAHNGVPQETLRQRLIQQSTALLYSPNGDDAARVELTLRDGTRLLKHTRDFLTGAVVDQAVCNAVDKAAYEAARQRDRQPGLTAADLVESLHEVVESLVSNLTAFNVHDYVDLPQEAAVAHLRRLPQPAGRMMHAALS